MKLSNLTMLSFALIFALATTHSVASENGKISIVITELEESGKDCNVRMSFHNGTGKKVNSYQMRNIEVSTETGIVQIQHSDNFKIQIDETYTRGGLMVFGTRCSAVSQILIKETGCSFKVPMSQYDKRSCVEKVDYQGSDNVQFMQVK